MAPRALTALFLGMAFGHASPAGPAFEVASVKLNNSQTRPSGDVKNGTLTMYNVPMKMIIARAYQVTWDRIVGPGWLDTQGYDIVAKFSPDATENLWQMLANLLAERFKLAVHHDRTPVPVYALVVGKNGPKLKEAAGDSQTKSLCSHGEGEQLICRSQKTSMAQLIENLRQWGRRDFFDLPVVDLTGLSGAYDFSLTFTRTARPLEAVPTDGDLFDAIQEQLGLKLEQRKVPVDRIIIDHIERIPTEN